MITMELYELKNMCMEISELAVANYIKRTMPAKDQISQREAYRLYGEGKVKDWVRNGLITQRSRMGSTIRSKIIYSRAELISIENAIKMSAIINR